MKNTNTKCNIKSSTIVKIKLRLKLNYKTNKS